MKPGPVLSWAGILTILVVGVSYLTFGVVGVPWFDHFTRATMTLTNSAGLVARSPIMLSGLRIGQVTGVRNETAGVVVEFRFDSAHAIPRDSTVRIENLSALGETYVQFTPRSAGCPCLTDGQAVDSAAVTMPLSFPQIAGRVADFVAQLHPETIAALVNTMSTGLAGTDALVPRLARSTDLLAATLISRMPRLRTLFTDLQTLGADATWVGQRLAESGPRWAEFGVGLDAEIAAIGHFIAQRPVPDFYTKDNGLLPFLNGVSDFLERAGPDLRALRPSLQPLTDAATDSLGRLDLSALIAQALAATDPAGAVRVQVGVR